MFKKEFIKTIEPRVDEFEIISLEQFQKLIKEVKGSKFCTICTITEPGLKRSLIKEGLVVYNPYWTSCVKVARNNINFNFDYTRSVNNKLKKISSALETEHISSPRLFGTHLKDSPFISHINKFGEHNLYLEANVLKVLDYGYWDIYTGLPLDKDKVGIWLNKKKEQIINYKNYNVRNVATIVIDGKGYLISKNII